MSEETKEHIDEIAEAREKLIKGTDDIVADLRKDFGDKAGIHRLGSSSALDVKVRSSGSLLLDLALGGGFPQGKLSELQGKEKSGKTTLANIAIARAQVETPELENAILDLEHSYNPEWARTLGVDTDRLIVVQPETHAEDVYSMLKQMLTTGKFAFIVLDSVAGLVPKSEFEEDSFEKEGRVGGTSKLNASAMRRLVNSGLLTKSGTCLLFVNQLRDKIGGFSLFGTPTDTPGGRALPPLLAKVA